MRLSEAGRLAETSGIDLVSYAGSEASLVFDNLIAGQDDRVADSIDIHSWGGGIRTIGAGRPQPDTERLGQLTLEAGRTRLHVAASTQLTLGDITRNARTTLELNGGLLVESIAPTDLKGDILPAWITFYGQQFATYNSQGGASVFEGYRPLSGAGADDNVELTARSTSAPDQIINSLKLRNEARLRIDGTLTIDSGGLILDSGSLIDSGQLTAGAASEYTLYMHGRGGEIRTPIVDNGSNPVSVVVDSHARFTGKNTYSGGTWVVDQSDLSVDLDGLPAESDLVLSGGGVTFVPDEPGIVRLNSLSLTRNSQLSFRDDNLPMDGEFGIEVNHILIDTSRIDIPLVGEGLIEKTGHASVSIRGTDNFQGTILVREGSLVFSNESPQTTIQLAENTELTGSTRATIHAGPAPILSGTLRGPLVPADASRVQVAGNLTLGDIEFAPASSLSFDLREDTKFAGVVVADVVVPASADDGTPASINDTGSLGVRVNGNIVATSPRSTLVIGNTVDIGAAGFSVPLEDSILRVLSSGGELKDLQTFGEVSGNGTIENALIAGSASPGQDSTGLLQFGDDLWLRSRSRGNLLIEISDPLSEAGVGWDAIEVSGILQFGLSEMTVSSLANDHQSGALPSFDPRTSFSLRIASAREITGTLPTIESQTFREDNDVPPLFGFSLREEPGSLFLDYGFTGDADGDGQLTTEDIDFFCGVDNDAFDVNVDGQFDAADLHEYMARSFNVLPGDADLNGRVEIQDFLLLSRHFGSPGQSWTTADFDCSGTVDLSDFLALSRNFGQVVPTTRAVPEPAPPLWILLWVFCCQKKRRRVRNALGVVPAK